MLPIKLILCPTDFSGPSETCVRTAAELAEHFGAELLLVNVVPAVPSLPPDPNYVFKIPEYERYLHAYAEQQLRKAREEGPAWLQHQSGWRGRPPDSRRDAGATRCRGISIPPNNFSVVFACVRSRFVRDFRFSE